MPVPSAPPVLQQSGHEAIAARPPFQISVMFEHMKHAVDRVILAARVFQFTAGFNHPVFQQTIIDRSCGQKAMGNGAAPISQNRLQPLLVMQEVGLASGSQQIILVDPAPRRSE